MLFPPLQSQYVQYCHKNWKYTYYHVILFKLGSLNNCQEVYSGLKKRKSSKKNKSISIKKYRGRLDLNIGIILFAVVLFYLLITVVSYLGRDKISVYEVRKGSIVRDNSYTGLVIREEEAVNAETDGYISYYQNIQIKLKDLAQMNVFQI